jgi:hypothetical protein
MEFQFSADRTILGTAFTRAGEEEFSLSERDRMTHCLCIGKTGHGKTTLLTNIAVQDIYAGRGIAVIDPHGDMSRALLEYLPSWRARDLVYINPVDEERVVSFNMVASVPRNRIAFVTASVVGAFKAIYGDSWGPRMERILYQAVAALVEAPNTSLVGLPKFLKSPSYRHEVLGHVRDPMVRDFFLTEYDQWDEKYRMQNTEAVLNKVEQLFASPFLRATFGTTTSSIDFIDILDNRKILIANLSTGTLGESHAQLLGAMLVSSIANAAMARGAIDTRDVAPEERVPFYLIVDEFEHFATESFAHIFSELRKQKLGAILSHQFLLQVPEYLRASVLGNCGSIVAFELGASDAAAIAPEIGLKNPDLLVDQAEGEAWVKHPRFAGPHHPRLLQALRPHGTGREAAVKQNRLRHTFPRARVDENIESFLANKT